MDGVPGSSLPPARHAWPAAWRGPHRRSAFAAPATADPGRTRPRRPRPHPDATHLYLDEQCNVARVAERRYTHRNTVVRWLGRCDELLPRRVADDPVGIGAALHLLARRGARGGG
ncbi:helix-turn-helix domain-containing protein [Streptomyces litmocidini]|uniref:helix-turn-helix domain-containing protein n=1 Tax=Streptomyces litmocidini TaxID=67318 RepID=UPI0036F5A1E3